MEERVKEANPSAIGEVVFNTTMTGYVEVITDPSFSGQIVCMTYPHIGNYGVDIAWAESSLTYEQKNRYAQLSGFIIRELYDGPVPTGRLSLAKWLLEENVPSLCNIDTRALTRYIRDKGSENAMMLSLESLDKSVVDKALTLLKKMPPMEGRNLVLEVGIKNVCEYREGHRELLKRPSLKPHIFPKRKIHVGVYDCGC